mgnify:CR=1 FL=1
MTSSLQQGISAAKAGRMQEALNFLKDAIIEEPQNADVWVWIAAIIDDINKQEIFLQKALEIDPNNIPAQRGMAYLKKRKEDEASVKGEHLSDHTSPISPFPASGRKNQSVDSPVWAKPSAANLELAKKQPENIETDRTPQESVFKNLPKLSGVEIALLGVVLIVFCLIGLLAASALFKFDLPLNFLVSEKPKLASVPPYPGVFLYENERFFNIQQHIGLPAADEGIPTSFEQIPILVFYQTDANPDQINLIFQTGEYISYQRFRGKGDSKILTPEISLLDGLYCLQYSQPSTSIQVTPYWCFKVAAQSETE